MTFEMKRDRGVFRIFVDGKIRSRHKFLQAALVEPGIYTCIEDQTGDRCRVISNGKNIVINYYNGNVVTI